MRIANFNGRLHLVTESGLLDVHQASGGRFGPAPQSVFEVWNAFRAWASDRVGRGVELGADMRGDRRLGSPVPYPRQIFGIGLNYREHVSETGFDVSADLTVFTKFPSAVAGPYATIELPSEFVDWEAELVVVIGSEARFVGVDEGWQFVAGVCAGQDLSERRVQSRPKTNPQYSLGKSFAGFAPIGPVLTTPDEFENPDDLAITCHLNGERVQSARTSELLTGVGALVHHLSQVVTLHPGDLIFTGTPSGVGCVMNPPRYLRPGDVVETMVQGVGITRHEFVESSRKVARS